MDLLRQSNIKRRDKDLVCIWDEESWTLTWIRQDGVCFGQELVTADALEAFFTPEENRRRVLAYKAGCIPLRLGVRKQGRRERKRWVRNGIYTLCKLANKQIWHLFARLQSTLNRS